MPLDLSTAKDISIIAAPLVKALVDELLVPRIKKIASFSRLSFNRIQQGFINQFGAYLLDSYQKYSTPNIIVFRNQQIKLKDIYIPLTISSRYHYGVAYTVDAYNESFFLNYKKILITDAAGMGKSTIMKWIFLSIIDKGAAIPVLIELRRLNKSNTLIDEIFSILKMIDKDTDKDLIIELIKEGSFIFLLDGFDEIEINERKYVLEDLDRFISKAGENYFMMTSRPEQSLASFSRFMEFYIRPLEVTEAFDLLRKYDRHGNTSSLLIKELSGKNFESVKEFMVNPLLVSLLHLAFDYKQKIPFQKHAFYRQVYDALFESHDIAKGDSFSRNPYSSLSSYAFHRVLRHIGYQCMKLNKIEFEKDNLIKIIGLAKDFCSDLEFDPLNFFKDLISVVPLFIQEEIYYRWAHKSLQEYFAAQFIYNDTKENQGKVLKTMAFSKEVNNYINVLDIYHGIDIKSFNKHVVNEILLDYIDYEKKFKFIHNEKYTKLSRDILYVYNLCLFKFLLC